MGEDKDKFNTCGHRSFDAETHPVFKEDCHCVKLKTAYACHIKNIFPVGIRHCYNCELYKKRI